jgi:hypothetical protein
MLGYRPAPTRLDLTDEETVALLSLLTETIIRFTPMDQTALAVIGGKT